MAECSQCGDEMTDPCEGCGRKMCNLCGCATCERGEGEAGEEMDLENDTDDSEEA